MADILPPSPTDAPFGSYNWQDWYIKVRNAINAAASISWSQITNFTGSNLTQLATRSHQSLQNILGTTTSNTAFGHVPIAGAAHQVLTKNTTTDYDYSWQTSSGGGSGGLSFDNLKENLWAVYDLNHMVTAYTGPVIKVRRSSDNTTLNVGYLTNNLIDLPSLLAFCSGTNGFVDTIYDQSGGTNHMVQTTTTAQPQIVSAGVYLGGIKHVGTNTSAQFFQSSTSSSGTTPAFHVFFKCTRASNATVQVFFENNSADTANDAVFYFDNTSTTYNNAMLQSAGSITSAAAWTPTEGVSIPGVIDALFDRSLSVIGNAAANATGFNGTKLSTTGGTNGTLTGNWAAKPWNIGGRGASSLGANILWQGCAIYETNQVWRRALVGGSL